MTGKIATPLNTVGDISRFAVNQALQNITSTAKTNARGDTLRYDPGTSTFGVLQQDGAPRTMFPPADGINY
ncbi:hypothetical protein [Pseudomonas putida]|uniref:hypothetical protein n=1 Tax=Pseudomonas putida TaxID=303 RepID=UPI00301BF06A